MAQVEAAGSARARWDGSGSWKAAYRGQGRKRGQKAMNGCHSQGLEKATAVQSRSVARQHGQVENKW